MATIKLFSKSRGVDLLILLALLALARMTTGAYWDCLDDDTGLKQCQPPTGKYLCAEGDSTYCSCRIVTYETPYQSADDCNDDCCAGYYNCDRAKGQCVFDLAGGYPREKCLELCGVDTYVCDVWQQQCVLSSNPAAVSKEECNANCGIGTVDLCVYQCTGFVFQTCITNSSALSLTCAGQGNGMDSALDDSACLSFGASCFDMKEQCCAGSFCDGASGVCTSYSALDDSPCVTYGSSCFDVQEQCCAGSVCDGASGVCTPIDGPPKPQQQICPGRPGGVAKFLGSSQDGLNRATCKQFDCNYDKRPCAPNQCPSVGNETNVCQITYASSDSSPSELRKRPNPRPAYLPSLLNPPTLAWRQDGQTRLFASTERAQHKAQWSDPLSNKQVLLEYDAVHAPDVLLLNQLSSLVGIDCHADGRMLMWLNGTDPSLEALIAALRNKPLLSGGREWECGFSDQEADIGKDGQAFNWTVKTIQRRVLSVGAVKLNGQHVVVQVFTKPAGFAEMFQSARLSFKTTMFPKAHHLHDLAQDPAHRAAFKSYLSHVNVDSEADAKLGWWPFSAITKVVDDFKALGQKVADVVKTVVHVAVAIATGTVDYDHTEDLASLRWNYDASSSGHVERDNWVIDDSVTCVACFLDLEVGFHMDLHIRDFELVSVAAWIEGQMTSQVNMNLDAEAQYNRANDTVLATVKVPDIDIVIGEIPMTISITIPVHAGYVFDLDATATVSAKGKMSGQVKYGFQYMPQDTSPLGGFQYIHFNSMDHEGLAVNMSLDVSAQLDVYIMPVIDISIDHLGGPNIGIKGFVEPVIQFKSSSPCNRGSSPWGPGSTYTINWGLQLTIGARLDVTLGPIHVLDKSWGPDQIFHIKWPLSSGCLRLPTDALLRGPGALGLIEPHYLGDQLHFFDGVAYSGEVVVSGASGCDQLLSIPVHFQIMNSSSGPETQNYPVWTSHSPHNWNRTNPDSNISSSVNMGCVNQATYLAIYGKFELFQTPVGQQSIDYKNCTLDTIKQGFTLMSLSGSYTLSPDLSTLTINTGSVCIGTVNLTRGLQAREGKRLGANPQYVWGSPRSATP